MCILVFVRVVIIVLIAPWTDAGTTINDTNTLFIDVLTEYNKYTRPVERQEEAMNVSPKMYIKTVQELDEVQGTLSFTGALFLSWCDAMIRWDPDEYGGASSLKLRFHHVWVPELLLVNQAEHTDSVGRSWHVVDYVYDGHAFWGPGGLFTSSCEISVRYYPFDIQICEVHFIVHGYTSQEVRIKEMEYEVDTSLFTSNPSWELIETSAKSMNFTGTIPGILFKLHLKRKPEFVIVNIMMPILFLSLLNVLAFVLVPESGERVSYCITVLLSVAVFLTIVSDNLPKSSEPIPLISYKLMVDMVISSAITFMTILNLNIYHKSDEDKVPKCMQTLYQCLTHCRFIHSSNTIVKSTFKSSHATQHFNQRDRINANVLTIKEEEIYIGREGLHVQPKSIKRQRAAPENLTTLNKTSTVAVNATSSGDMRIEDELCEQFLGNALPPVTWRQISRMLDWVFQITFTLASVASFASFLLIAS